MEVVKVGAINYAIEHKDIQVTNDGTQFGWCRYDEAKIEINTKINEQKQEQTLIHEITHAIFHEAGLDEQNNDEELVNKVALMLHQVLKENDFSWIRK